MNGEVPLLDLNLVPLRSLHSFSSSHDSGLKLYYHCSEQDSHTDNKTIHRHYIYTPSLHAMLHASFIACRFPVFPTFILFAPFNFYAFQQPLFKK